MGYGGFGYGGYGYGLGYGYGGFGYGGCCYGGGYYGGGYYPYFDYPYYPYVTPIYTAPIYGPLQVANSPPVVYSARVVTTSGDQPAAALPPIPRRLRIPHRSSPQASDPRAGTAWNSPPVTYYPQVTTAAFKQPAKAAAPGSIRVVLPDPHATVLLNGNGTASTGANGGITRLHSLGGPYNYSLRVTWMQDGQPVTQERTVRSTRAQPPTSYSPQRAGNGIRKTQRKKAQGADPRDTLWITAGSWPWLLPARTKATTRRAMTGHDWPNPWDDVHHCGRRRTPIPGIVLPPPLCPRHCRTGAGMPDRGRAFPGQSGPRPRQRLRTRWNWRAAREREFAFAPSRPWTASDQRPCPDIPRPCASSPSQFSPGRSAWFPERRGQSTAETRPTTRTRV